MSGRTDTKSKIGIKHALLFFYILLSSNSCDCISLLTDTKGQNKELSTLMDVLSSFTVILRRQVTNQEKLIGHFISKTENEIAIMKKSLTETQKEFMFIKEENKRLKEEVLKHILNNTEYKTILERLDNQIKEMNSDTQKLKKRDNNETRDLIILLKEKDDLIHSQDKRHLKQDTAIQKLEVKVDELNEQYTNKTRELITRLKKQDDLIFVQSKQQTAQEKVIQKLKSMVSELMNNDKNKTQELIPIKDQEMFYFFITPELMVSQNKRIKEQGKDIQRLYDITDEVNEQHKNDTQKLIIRLDDQCTCRDILNSDYCRKSTCTSGVHSIYLNSKWTSVWCDMETDGGGWTVIQRRQNGNVDFFRTWKEYKDGFGNSSDEYWIGNDALHFLTTSRNVALRVDLEQFNGIKGHTTFSTFVIANETNNYRLSLSGYTGNKKINNCLSYSNRSYFTTKDRDNDRFPTNCADYRHAGWWYNYCTQANLNGQYYTSERKDDSFAIFCFQWTNQRKTSLKRSTMMIR